MAAFSIMNQFEVQKNAAFLEKARALSKPLHRKEIVLTPQEKAMKRGDRCLFDFGNHYVGYLELKLESRGSHPDAPAYLRVRMAEHAKELDERAEDYDGWLGKGWIQEEYLHIDTFPETVRIPRRYAFRYAEITVIDTSAKYQVVITELKMNAVSAVEENIEIPMYGGDPLLRKIDEVGCHTLAECMQDVFEDGPKRDRRMWLGDLRIQALTNYAVFRNYDLVKRCLYLFAGLLFNENQMSACIFMEPEEEPDDTFLIDYALQFVSTLWEYYEASKDKETLEELYPAARDQLQYAHRQLDERGLIPDHPGEFYCFLDWGDDLNKEAGGNAVYVSCLSDGMRIAETLGKKDDLEEYHREREAVIASINRYLFDESQGYYVSGAEKEISRHTQIWMMLSGAAKDPERLLEHLDTLGQGPELRTPYAYYYYVLALLKVGKKDLALQKIREYWGGMIEDQADTFYEVYDAEHPDFSPYGSLLLNSYCHAWSCGVVAILREYFAD